MLKTTVAPLTTWGLLPLRLVVGLVFLVHGAQKLFQFGLGGTAGFLGSLGVPAPTLAAVVVIAVELLGGLALISGAFTRVVALVLAVHMLVAIVLVHLTAGFFLPKGYEFALTLLGANLTLFLTGAGAASVDAALGPHPGARARG
ncbi:MAG: DoxX family protein [Candidatus Rokubacteria bacterium]|nr:DoxX family protein [Candidatus Rokubacteria bacterium]MBI3105872.1 DoxX family protein [Candidatus Rokubacteria bacterium]